MRALPLAARAGIGIKLPGLACRLAGRAADGFTDHPLAHDADDGGASQNRGAGGPGANPSRSPAESWRGCSRWPSIHAWRTCRRSSRTAFRFTVADEPGLHSEHALDLRNAPPADAPAALCSRVRLETADVPSLQPADEGLLARGRREEGGDRVASSTSTVASRARGRSVGLGGLVACSIPQGERQRGPTAFLSIAGSTTRALRRANAAPPDAKATPPTRNPGARVTKAVSLLGIGERR